jgi:hypothetical protein
MVLSSGRKLNVGLLATITLEAVSFRLYAPFSELLSFSKCILEVVFCAGIQHRLRFYLDHLNCFQIATFQFYLQSWKQTNVGRVGDVSRVVFGKKFFGEKNCETVHCRDATVNSFVAKVRGEVFSYVHAAAVKRHNSMRH